MNDPLRPLPAGHTVAAFNARMIELVALAIEEAAIDLEIILDGGTDFDVVADEETALEYLEESDIFGAIRDPELRDAYRGAYIAAFVGS